MQLSYYRGKFFPYPEGEIRGTSFVEMRLCYLLISEMNGASFENHALDLQLQ
jgi:hypothetical protein